MTVETLTGPTPNGGDRSVAVYFNDQMVEVDKSVATRVVITEYKGDDWLFETWGRIGSVPLAGT